MRDLSKRAIEEYSPPAELQTIAEVMISGETNPQAIAHAAGIGTRRYNTLMADPLNLAWVAGRVEGAIQNLVGLADAAIMRKAMEGDVKAYEAILKRYGLLVKKSVSASYSHSTLDFSDKSNEDLETLVAQKLKETKLIDVEASEKKKK